MTPENFVQALKAVAASALAGLLNAIEFPPGRKPAPDLLRISRFYIGLNEEDRQTFVDALKLAGKQSINNFLLILDGSLAIESRDEKGKLELYYADGSSRIRLNEPDGVPLSDIFRWK